MIPPYSFNFGYDPLLQKTFDRNGDYNTQIDQRIEELERLRNGYKQAPAQTVSIWDEIDREVASLTEDQKKILFNAEEYNTNSINIQNLVQQELINSVKHKIEESKEGKELLEKQLNFVKSNKQEIVNIANKEYELFKKFQIAAKANPELKYEEFIKTISE